MCLMPLFMKQTATRAINDVIEALFLRPYPVDSFRNCSHCKQPDSKVRNKAKTERVRTNDRSVVSRIP